VLSGVDHGPEATAEPVRQVAQAAEILGPDGLGGLDLHAYHGAGRMKITAASMMPVAVLPMVMCAICR
jgi:hypothetical protein